MIHKKLLSLLVLLMTAASGAWATVYNSGEVSSADLKVGDIIYNAQIGNYFKLAANRYKYQNVVQNVNSAPLVNIGIDADGLLFQKYRPVTADGQDGNAWVVVEKMSVSPYSGEVQVLLGGIIYDPNSVYPTTDAQKEGDFFTEATFTMPAFDATVDYDIVRDMEDATSPVEFSGLSKKVVVKKKTGTEAYEPLTTPTIQLIDGLAATDAQNIIDDAGIKVNVLKGTDNNGTITYDEINTLTLTEFLENTEPGLYKIVAEPKDPATSPYTGTASLEFQTLTGYPVEVPGKEYITYYSATENLTEDDDDAKLYTITAVSASTVTATEIPSADKEMPFLVYNSSDKDKTIVLIPTDVQINQTYADEFVGTAVAATIAASTEAQNNYALNGKEFVWVRTAIPVAANKAWLEVPVSNANNASLRIVIKEDETTEIEEVDGGDPTSGSDDSWYDLSGRKLDGEPTTKGVYIKNGRKVVIK